MCRVRRGSQSPLGDGMTAVISNISSNISKTWAVPSLRARKPAW